MNNTENPNLQNRQTEINKTENIFRETHQVLKERCLFALSSLTGWLQYHSTIKSMKISFLFLCDHQQLVVFLLLIYLEVLWSIRHTSVWKDTIVGSNFFQLVQIFFCFKSVLTTKAFFQLCSCVFHNSCCSVQFFCARFLNFEVHFTFNLKRNAPRLVQDPKMESWIFMIYIPITQIETWSKNLLLEESHATRKLI